MVQSLRKRDKLMEVGGVSNFIHLLSLKCYAFFVSLRKKKKKIDACQFLISDTWNSRAYFVGQRI